MSRGPNVFAVSRSIWADSDFASEPFTEREAWIWLISAAAWKDIRARGNAGAVALKRGEFSFAVRFLAEKWQWSKSRVDRFIHRIKNRDMIRDTSRDGSSIYIINNYNRFQVVGLPKRDSDQDDIRDNDGTAAGQQRDKEETGETGKQEIEQEPPAIAVASLPILVSRETLKAYPAWLPLAAWGAYVEMRKRKRAKMTPHAENLVLKRLEKWVQAGHDPTEILDQSTRSNWTDIYEPKSGQANGQRTKPASAHDKFNAGVSLYIASLGPDADESGEGEPVDHAGPARLPLLAS